MKYGVYPKFVMFSLSLSLAFSNVWSHKGLFLCLVLVTHKEDTLFMSHAVHFNRPNGDISTYWMDGCAPREFVSERLDDDDPVECSGNRQRVVVVIKLTSPARRYFAHQACAAFSQSVSYPQGGSPSKFNQEVERMLMNPTSTAYSRRRTRIH